MTRLAISISVLLSLPLLAPTSHADQARDVQVPGGAATDVNAAGNTVLAQYGGRFRIFVISATYGGNCGVRPGNVTYAVADACNGRRVCEYAVNYRILGDPARGCGKDFTVRWHCGDGEQRRTGAPPEAGYGSVVVLSCRGGGYD